VKVILIILNLLLCVFPPKLLADPLAHVESSKDYQRLDRELARQRRLDRTQISKWMDPNSNFGRLFVDPASHHDVVKWLTTDLRGCDTISSGKVTYVEYIEIYSSLRCQKGKLVTYRLLVPHPKFLPMLDYQLIRRFKELTPPESEIEHFQKIDIQEHESKVFIKKNASCLVQIPVERRSIIEVRMKDCGSKIQQLIEVARTLDLKRFNQKITQ